MYTLHYFPLIGKYCIFSEAMTTLSSSLCYVVFIFLLLLLYFFFCFVLGSVTMVIAGELGGQV